MVTLMLFILHEMIHFVVPVDCNNFDMQYNWSKGPYYILKSLLPFGEILKSQSAGGSVTTVYNTGYFRLSAILERRHFIDATIGATPIDRDCRDEGLISSSRAYFPRSIDDRRRLA